MTEAPQDATEAVLATLENIQLYFDGWMGSGNAYAKALDKAATLIRTLRTALAEAEARERERCAKDCEDNEASFGSNEYAVGQPDSSFRERFACRMCAESIRALSPSAIRDDTGMAEGV